MCYAFEKYRVLGKDYLILDEASKPPKLGVESLRLICTYAGGNVERILVCPQKLTAQMAIYSAKGWETFANGTDVCACAVHLRLQGRVEHSKVRLRSLAEEFLVQFPAQSGDEIPVLIQSLNKAKFPDARLEKISALEHLPIFVQPLGTTVLPEDFLQKHAMAFGVVPPKGAPIDSFARAKEIYLYCGGSSYIMWHEGYFEEYQKFHVPVALEQQWTEEFQLQDSSDTK